MVKKILKIVLWAVTGAALIVLFVFGRKQYLDTPLKGINFQLERCHRNGFVEKDSVITHAEAICNIKRQASISSVDMMQIQKLLDDNPWIDQASAYIGLNDTLVIKAKEFEPMLRVFNHDKSSVYVTREGVIFPSCPHYSPRVIIASGNFDFPKPGKNSRVTDSIYANAGLNDALTIALAIGNDPFLSGNVGQIYKNEQNEYELVVNNLSARVILSDTDALENKLARLSTLLEKFSGTEELNAYKTLNLKYKNQIVCTK